MADRCTVVAQVGMVFTLGALVGAALLLASCSFSEDPSPSPSAASGASAEPSTTAAPSPSVVPVTVPASCENTVDEQVYAATFGGQTLNDPGYGAPTGVLTPTDPGEGTAPLDVVLAKQELFCIWGDSSADITQLNMGFSRVDPVVAAEYLADLAEEGFDCEETLGGERCQRVGTNAQFPVEEAETSFARDGIVIRIYQANFPTDNLLGSVVERVWG